MLSSSLRMYHQGATRIGRVSRHGDDSVRFVTSDAIRRAGTGRSHFLFGIWYDTFYSVDVGNRVVLFGRVSKVWIDRERVHGGIFYVNLFDHGHCLGDGRGGIFGIFGR